MNDASPGAAKPASEPQKPIKPAPQENSEVAKPAVSKPKINATVPPATMKRRHWGLFGSFLLIVMMPLMAVVLYMWLVAVDQYSSVTGFTVRQEEGGGASELLGGLAALTGSTASADSDILYEFIQSQALIQAVDTQLDLRGHYSALWEKDPAFALWPDPSIEDLESYWQRIVRISQSSGLIEVRVLAFDPEMAQAIAQAILAESQSMINALNNQAREDAMRYAREDLEEAVLRLKAARETLTAFRTRTQIVDPEADIQGRMGVMNNLQQQLAEALIELDLLRETTSDGDPRLVQARRRIEVIRDRIFDERRTVVSDTTENGAVGEDYPSLIAEFESLMVDREFAEGTYRASLAALDLARTKAARQSRYLATYVTPTLAQTSEFPQRFTIAGVVGLFLLLSWSVIVLVYYSIRDRS
ncbi:sugar transporter [Sulfitobacter sp. 15WGC]|uniref:sugar transporter n=1 Tax=Sulfitobacter sp. 15WGC TaxID=2575437 RepID=UPI0010AD3A72|nr:sugar transporter [Sulfitobacter sp. 15WGC]TKA84341.1 sugar transporter [Sulfitobacter sp. 15WGC]